MSYAHIIREDPVRRGLLYLGTENALYVSFDDGEHWQPMQLGMPHAPVYGLVIQENFNDLVVATYGRGMFILDDLTPLQKVTPTIMSSAAYLFPVHSTYRFRDVEANVSPSDDQTAGVNPQYGASINYWLKSAGEAPTITIVDSAGKTVRTLRGTATAGLNRVYWDLANEASRLPRMKTKPMYDDEFAMDADGTRAAPGFGSLSVLMPPGRYTVKLAAGGQSFSQPVDVLKDPNETASLADIRASAATLGSVQGDMNATADMLITVESVRSQIQTLIAANASMTDVKTDGSALEQKFITVEQTMVDPRMTGRGQDEVRYPVKLGGQLNYLSGGIAASDFAPTAQQREVAQTLAKQTRDTRTALQTLIQNDLAKFNALLRSRGLKTIDVSMPVVF
jgi:hypothetical protein